MEYPPLRQAASKKIRFNTESKSDHKYGDVVFPRIDSSFPVIKCNSGAPIRASLEDPEFDEAVIDSRESHVCNEEGGKKQAIPTRIRRVCVNFADKKTIQPIMGHFDTVVLSPNESSPEREEQVLNGELREYLRTYYTDFLGVPPAEGPLFGEDGSINGKRWVQWIKSVHPRTRMDAFPLFLVCKELLIKITEHELHVKSGTLDSILQHIVSAGSSLDDQARILLQESSLAIVILKELAENSKVFFDDHSMRLHEMKANAEEASLQAEQYRQEILGLKKEIVSAKCAVGDLESRKEVLTTELKRVGAYETMAKELQSELQKLRGEHQSLTAEAARVHHKYEETKLRLQSRDKERFQSSQTIEKLKVQFDQVVKEKNKISHSFEVLQERASLDIEALQKQIGELLHRESDLLEELERNSSEIEILCNRFKGLEELLALNEAEAKARSHQYMDTFNLISAFEGNLERQLVLMTEMCGKILQMLQETGNSTTEMKAFCILSETELKKQVEVLTISNTQLDQERHDLGFQVQRATMRIQILESELEEEKREQNVRFGKREQQMQVLKTLNDNLTQETVLLKGQLDGYVKENAALEAQLTSERILSDEIKGDYQKQLTDLLLSREQLENENGEQLRKARVISEILQLQIADQNEAQATMKTNFERDTEVLVALKAGADEKVADLKADLSKCLGIISKLEQDLSEEKSTRAKLQEHFDALTKSKEDLEISHGKDVVRMEKDLNLHADDMMSTLHAMQANFTQGIGKSKSQNLLLAGYAVKLKESEAKTRELMHDYDIQMNSLSQQICDLSREKEEISKHHEEELGAFAQNLSKIRLQLSGSSQQSSMPAESSKQGSRPAGSSIGSKPAASSKQSSKPVGLSKQNSISEGDLTEEISASNPQSGSFSPAVPPGLLGQKALMVQQELAALGEVVRPLLRPRTEYVSLSKIEIGGVQGTGIDELKQRLQNSESSMLSAAKQLEAQKQQYEGQIAGLDGKVLELTVQIQESASIMKTFDDQIRTLEEDRNKERTVLESQLLATRDEVKSLESNVECLQRENQETLVQLKSRLHGSLEQISSLQANCDKENGEHVVRMAVLKTQLQGYVGQIQVLEATLGTEKKDEHSGLISALRAQIEVCQTEIQAQEQVYEKFQVEVQAQQAEYENKVKDLIQEKELQEEAYAEVSKELSVSLEHAQALSADLVVHKLAAEQDRFDHQEQLMALAAANHQLAEERESLRGQLEVVMKSVRDVPRPVNYTELRKKVNAFLSKEFRP